MQLPGNLKILRRQLVAAIFAVAVSAVSLTASTYAWYVANQAVTGTTSTISATSDDTVLFIVQGLTPDHGSGSTVAAVPGHPITPSSTDNVKDWYVPLKWVDSLSKVETYQKVSLTTTDEYGVADGSYTLNGDAYYAYNVKTFTLYTVRDTSKANVYLDADAPGGAIIITRNVGGTQVAVTDKVAASIRVGIVVNDELKFVYAPVEPSGHGNDVYSIDNNVTGWTVVNNTSSTKAASYAHISGNNVSDWAISRGADSKYYNPATAGSNKVAENVDYNGVKFQIYVWMEGTDADCNGPTVSGDKSEYSVTVHLAGVATG